MDSISQIYRNRTYVNLYGKDAVIAISLVLACGTYLARTAYKGTVEQIQDDWAKNRCNPVYMPFAGWLMPVPGQSAMESTVKNFDYCVQQNMSIGFDFLLLPLEFAAFLIITTMDVVLQTIVASLAMLARLKLRLGGLFAVSFLKIADILVPIIVMGIKMRDTMAKANGVMVTTMFTAMTVYNVMISGMLNVMGILLGLLLALIGIVIGMFVLGGVLMATPVFPLGIALFAAANIITLAIVIPAVVIYILLHVFMMDTFTASSDGAPGIPGR